MDRNGATKATMNTTFKNLSALAALAALTITATAQAQTIIATPGTEAYIDKFCTRLGATFSCSTSISPTPQPRSHAAIIPVQPPTDPEEIAAAQARETEWLDVCRPVIARDQYGVSRYTYAPACPNGVVIGTLKAQK